MGVVQFDHAVVYVDSDERSQAFYNKFLGASNPHGPEPRESGGRVFHHTFMDLETRRQGVALFESPNPVPTPNMDREFTCVVYEVSNDRYEAAKTELVGVELDGPALGDSPTFYTHDSEGNPIGFVPGGPDTKSALKRLEMDVERLETGIRFYESVFGLGVPEVGALPEEWGRNDYARFKVGDFGQSVVIVEIPGAPSANVAQHLAFLVTRQDHLALKENLKHHGVVEAVGRAGGDEARVPGEVGTYVMDPWGRKLQWITHASTQD